MTRSPFCRLVLSRIFSFVCRIGLGWKNNPLALNWGSSSPMNLLMQVDIDENVNYEPIFSQGHPYQAGIISLAGMGLGNAVISLNTGLWLFSFARKRGLTALGLFAYWLTVMSLGNLISYVPMRVFTWHADMRTVAIGLGWTQDSFYCSLVFLPSSVSCGSCSVLSLLLSGFSFLSCHRKRPRSCYAASTRSPQETTTQGMGSELVA
jgi:hypothetical protein